MAEHTVNDIRSKFNRIGVVVSVHDAEWALYDAVPGEEIHGQTSVWKTLQTGTARINFFRPDTPREGA